MSEGYWILRDREPVAATREERALFFGDVAARRVALDDLGDGLRVSTVFLGLDHRITGTGPPILFETLALADEGSPHESLAERTGMLRYTSWAQAERGHVGIVAEVRARLAEARSGV